jgi:hypothetical protein
MTKVKSKPRNLDALRSGAMALIPRHVYRGIAARQ